VAGVVTPLLDNDFEKWWYGERQLKDLQRRSIYLTAVLLVDLCAKSTDDSAPASEVRAALKELKSELDRAQSADPGLLAAIRMVLLCGQLLLPATDKKRALPHPIDDATIQSELLAGLADSAKRSPRPALSAAAYYDAACVYSLLARPSPEASEQTTPAAAGSAGPDPLQALLTPVAAGVRRLLSDGEGVEPSEGGVADNTTKTSCGRALDMLRLALEATPEASRPRLRQMAQTDPTLAYVKAQQPAGFQTALGITSEVAPHLRVAVALSGAGNA
jgi:hypothetical protein